MKRTNKKNRRWFSGSIFYGAVSITRRTHTMSFCCSRTCGSRCAGSCRRSAISNIIFTDIGTQSFSVSSTSPYTVIPSQLFSVNCPTNVNIQFAGTVYYDIASSPQNAVLKFTLQYYNVAAPGIVNSVPVPLQALVRGSTTVQDVVPFTAVQTASLTAGTYSAQLVISVATTSPTPTVSGLHVDGSLSVFQVRVAA